MATVTQTTPPALLSAQVFARQYADRRAELVKGHIVELSVPSARHGKICNWIGFYLTQYIVANDIGHVMTNDSLFVIAHDPDTARGPDVCFVSYARLPKGRVPDGLLDVVPELVFEVRSPSDRWTAILEKVLEYLAAGVVVVVVLDLKTDSASVFRGEDRQDIVAAGETLTVPDVLPGFAVPVGKLFA